MFSCLSKVFALAERGCLGLIVCKFRFRMLGSGCCIGQRESLLACGKAFLGFRV